ncbi:saccharopine dehydrogenase NADP-binding domain-containing protein [uncultured Clostridium sp.]|uniref:saccharopine dehydrogenase NADP-binding domain-containing protein n=1 Tax=uncultured Clostridium sp. TaxID=59620 RepID=UPI0025FB57AE|nr:saccharopine dehydrogenase NADP-binding domain-containing protein [uncultured Clostridium sp.]
MSKVIGVLGATGLVGIGAVENLLLQSNIDILIGCRNIEKAKKIYGDEIKEKIIEVDIFNLKALKEFCNKCDIVINCAGPSAKVLNIVADTCIDLGKDYIDVSGDKDIYNSLVNKAKDIEDKNILCLIGAGAYPGLTEIFPPFVANKYFDNVEKLEEFFAGCGQFSENAAYDIVSSIEKDQGYGMCYCRDGKLEKIKDNLHSSYELPTPAGKLDVYPVISDEFIRGISRSNIENAYFYNTYPNKDILMQFITIKMMEQYKTEEEKRESAKALSQKYSEGNLEYTMYIIEASGIKDNEKLRIKASLYYEDNWNKLTGVIAACTAILICNDNTKRGYFYASDIIKEDLLIEKLMNCKVNLDYFIQ